MAKRRGFAPLEHGRVVPLWSLCFTFNEKLLQMIHGVGLNHKAVCLKFLFHSLRENNCTTVLTHICVTMVTEGPCIQIPFFDRSHTISQKRSGANGVLR